MKSHLKGVGRSGPALSSPSASLIFSSPEPESKTGPQRGLVDPRVQARQATRGRKEGPAPKRNSSSIQ